MESKNVVFRDIYATGIKKQKLILPTAHKEFMNLYHKVINKTNFDNLKRLFPRSKNSILKTKPK